MNKPNTAIEMDEVPDEQGIAYSPDRYMLSPGRDKHAYRPSNYLKLDKQNNFEGWLLLQTDPEGREFKVEAGDC